MSQGVCSHSTESSQEEWVIHSVQPKNIQLYEQWLKDEGVPHKVLVGRYKGQLEPAYMVPAWKVEDIKQHMWLQGQDCVLQLDPCNARGHRRAYLVYGSSYEFIGMFQHTPLGPRDQDDYTYDPKADQYYVVAPAKNASDKPLSRLSARQREYAVYRQSAEAA